MNLNRLDKKIRYAMAIAIAAGLVAVIGSRMASPSGNRPADLHILQRGDFDAWSVFEGAIQAERSAPLYSRISQPSAVLFLVPEGKQVDAGELVVELDRSSLDQNLANLERDLALATAELAVLQQSDLPSELATTTDELNTIRYDLQKQERIVANTETLLESGLVSGSEMESQRMLLENLQRKSAFLENRLIKLHEVVHPAREAKALAQFEAALRQVELLREQVDGARMTAPFAGMVVYQPVHIDGEFRNVREGDTVYRNQKIIQIADMESLLVHCQVPEASISLVRPGNPAIMTPAAFPALKLRGVVESVGSVAVSVAGKPAWQKFFNVTIRLVDSDERLRSSMSVSASMLAHEERDALLIPRAFVGWDRGAPWCVVTRQGNDERRQLQLGPANDNSFIVRSGVQPGETVKRPRSAP